MVLIYCVNRYKGLAVGVQFGLTEEVWLQHYCLYGPDIVDVDCRRGAGEFLA